MTARMNDDTAVAERSVTVALDLMGGDDAPAAMLDGALLVLAEQPGVRLTLVGRAEVALSLLRERGAAGELEGGSARLRLVEATQVIGMDEDPARAVRAKRDASVRVAARLVRDGQADATVSAGSTGAAMAAALLTLGRLPGMSRPAVAVVVPAAAGPLVLLDAGANPDAGADLLAQFALAGAALARTRLGVADPAVGLLSIGAEPGKGDELRKAAFELMAALPVRFVGNVEAAVVPLGGVDVVVTDGFTGNVLLKGVEGTARMLTERLLAAFTADDDRRAAARMLAPALAEVAAELDPDRTGGAVLLGVDGVAVVGHGASSPRAVGSCVAVAVSAVRAGLVPRVAEGLADLVARRRRTATDGVRDSAPADGPAVGPAAADAAPEPDPVAGAR